MNANEEVEDEGLEAVDEDFESLRLRRCALLNERSIAWTTVSERQTLVRTLHREGQNLKLISRTLQVPYITVRRDCDFLGLSSFTLANDDELIGIISDIIETGHSGMGAYVKIKGALREKGIRIPLKRLNSLLVFFSRFS
jgi:hypothetical protein